MASEQHSWRQGCCQHPGRSTDLGDAAIPGAWETVAVRQNSRSVEGKEDAQEFTIPALTVTPSWSVCFSNLVF